MKKQWISIVVFACGFMLLASTTWAGKAEIEKKAKETKVTLNLAKMAPGAALDLVSMISGITIKKTDIPKDAAIVNVELKNESVLDAVKRVTDLAGLSYSISDAGIEVSGKKTPEVKKSEGIKGKDLSTRETKANDPAVAQALKDAEVRVKK
jgi:hypothetical protein